MVAHSTSAQQRISVTLPATEVGWAGRGSWLLSQLGTASLPTSPAWLRGAIGTCCCAIRQSTGFTGYLISRYPVNVRNREIATSHIIIYSGRLAMASPLSLQSQRKQFGEQWLTLAADRGLANSQKTGVAQGLAGAGITTVEQLMMWESELLCTTETAELTDETVQKLMAAVAAGSNGTYAEASADANLFRTFIRRCQMAWPGVKAAMAASPHGAASRVPSASGISLAPVPTTEKEISNCQAALAELKDTQGIEAPLEYQLAAGSLGKMRQALLDGLPLMVMPSVAKLPMLSKSASAPASPSRGSAGCDTPCARGAGRACRLEEGSDVVALLKGAPEEEREASKFTQVLQNLVTLNLGLAAVLSAEAPPGAYPNSAPQTGCIYSLATGAKVRVHCTHEALLRLERELLRHAVVVPCTTTAFAAQCDNALAAVGKAVNGQQHPHDVRGRPEAPSPQACDHRPRVSVGDHQRDRPPPSPLGRQDGGGV